MTPSIRRFLRWAWERDHDDKVPNLVAGISLAIVVGAVVSLWLLVVVVALVAAVVLLSGEWALLDTDGRSSPRRSPGDTLTPVQGAARARQ